MWNYETGREISDADGRKNWIALSHPDPTDRPNIVRTAEGRLQLNSTVLPEAIQIPSNANIAVFSPERRRLVICLGATAQIWDLQSDDLTANLTVGEAVWGAKFSNDGSRVVTISRHFWRVWNADRGDLLASIGDWGDLAPCAAIFNPDATRIVVASEQSVEVWDVNSGTRVAALKLPLDSHITMVSAECDLVCALQKNGKRRGWRIFPSTQSLVEHAKEIIPRGLTREQRHQVFLDPDPPAWCIEMDKWPYQS
jgi:WD40 repeat protein